MSDFPPPPPPPMDPMATGVPAAPYTAWPQRVLGYLIDYALFIPGYALYAIGLGIGDAIGMLIVLIGFVAIVGVFVWNICIKQGTTGQTVDKGVIGIKLIGEQTGQPIGAGLAFVRAIAHILDSIPCLIGYLWPLWDEKRQTFADKIMKTIVVDVPK